MDFRIVVLICLVVLGLAQCNAAEPKYREFPSDFLFGVATAAHQIEGAWNLSGKSENVWDHLAHYSNDLIADGSTADIAVDSYNRYEEDVEELEHLGVGAYRLSLSWPRILPTGRIDRINQEGVEYYNKLINLLLSKGIEPMVTLFHWDMPQVLMDLGGWANPYIVDYFKDYANVVFSTFGDRVKMWITINEPYEVCEDGYGDEKKAPAILSNGVGNYLCGHNLLKAHAEAYHLYNDTYRPSQGGRIMISINSIFYAPLNSESLQDEDVAEVANQFKFGWFAHPIYSKEGNYPQAMITRVSANSFSEGLIRSRLPEFEDYWINRIRGTADLLGINHYTTHLITPGVDPTAMNPSWLGDIGGVVSLNIGADSASEWLRIYPEGFGDMLRWVNAEYDQPEIMITENGVSDRGDLIDDRRIQYFNDYLSELLIALYDDNVKITGYVAWTLMDNWEWRAGFSERFGLYSVNVNDPTLPRTAKKSAAYFKELAETKVLPVISSENLKDSNPSGVCRTKKNVNSDDCTLD